MLSFRSSGMGVGLLVAVMVIALSGRAQAISFDDVIVEYWSGSGAHASMLITDFGDASFAFGYRWEDSATSWDMLQAVQAGGSFDFTFTDYGLLGMAINSITYGSYHVESDWDVTFLGFWISEDGLAWYDPVLGVSSRVLAAESWDGWSREFVAAGWDAVNAPRVPLPEPASLTLIGVGALLLLRRR
jgi:hypothetical protein